MHTQRRRSVKNAKPLPGDSEAAAAFFKTRARKRNPAVAASRSNKALVEADDGRTRRLPAPRTAAAATHAGSGAHGVVRTAGFDLPPGAKPLKIQLTPNAVTVIEDGYLVFAGALHPSGVTYRRSPTTA